MNKFIGNANINKIWTPVTKTTIRISEIFVIIVITMFCFTKIIHPNAVNNTLIIFCLIIAIIFVTINYFVTNNLITINTANFLLIQVCYQRSHHDC